MPHLSSAPSTFRTMCWEAPGIWTLDLSIWRLFPGAYFIWTPFVRLACVQTEEMTENVTSRQLCLRRGKCFTSSHYHWCLSGRTNTCLGNSSANSLNTYRNTWQQTPQTTSPKIVQQLKRHLIRVCIAKTSKHPPILLYNLHSSSMGKILGACQYWHSYKTHDITA